MVLVNLMSVADKSLPMALHTKIRDKNCRYNFTTQKFGETFLTEDKIITVGEFLNHPKFTEFMNCKLITWGIQPTRGVASLTDELKSKFPKILSISISLEKPLRKK